MGILILLAVIAGIILLGRYAIAEGHRIERNKRFLKDFKEFDKNKIKNKQ